MDGNIDEVRSSHKGVAQPPSLVAGVRWIDDSASVWSSKVYDGGGMLTEAFIDPASDIITPVQLRLNNLIWNGAMDVWQDGTSETGVTANNLRCADGWRFEVAGHGTWTLDRSAVVPTVAQAGRNVNFSHRFACTTADGTVAAGDVVSATFTIEGFDYQELYQQPQHISFWARSTLVGTYGLSLRNSGDDRTFVFTFTIDVANTYELKQFVLRDIPSGGTWDFETGRGLSLAICFAAGTNFHTTANAWQTGNFRTTSAQANLAALNTHTFNIADVRLHAGTSRSPVIVRSFQETLARAQRYFWKTFQYATKPAQNVASQLGTINSSADGTHVFHEVRFPNRMRVTPTLTAFNPVAADSNWDGGTDIASSFTTPSESGFIAEDLNNDALDQNQYAIHATASARF